MILNTKYLEYIPWRGGDRDTNWPVYSLVLQPRLGTMFRTSKVSRISYIAQAIYHHVVNIAYKICTPMSFHLGYYTCDFEFRDHEYIRESWMLSIFAVTYISLHDIAPQSPVRNRILVVSPEV